MYTLRFDMRTPASGAPATALYAAAIEMSAWAESNGCLAVVLCEHHGSDDGYLPAPLILAAAVAALTRRLALSLVVILPFCDPVRLAEEMSVLDHISAGRASYILALGYRPAEFRHYGLDIAERGRLADEKLNVLRGLLGGESVDIDGRQVSVTPAPGSAGGAVLMWGGGSLAAARRAGRYGLGLLANANVSGMQETYEAACRAHGHRPGAVLLPGRDTPSVCFVADDVDAAWVELGPYLLHDARAYSEWNPDNITSAGICDAQTVAELRASSSSHIVISIPAAVQRIQAGELLNLSPLCGGLPPETAWKYLRHAGEAVALASAQTRPEQPPRGLGDALIDLTATQRM